MSLYRSKRSVKVGELERYKITYEPSRQDESPPSSIWLKVRNLENITLRAAFLRGPYILYVDVRSQDYHHSKATFITADQPKFEPNLLPGQSFIVELPTHTIKEKYVWIVDVVSQIVFSPTSSIMFELVLGRNKAALEGSGDDGKCGTFSSDVLVNRQNTLDLWNLPEPMKQGGKKLHLVVVTHGLHSNAGADMFYIKDQLDAMAQKTGENLIVRGYNENVCKTEKGVRYLGIRLARFVVEQVEKYGVESISFIGHSLGGLIQVFAVTYIELKHPGFFQRVKPVNFITLATPFLGIVTDNPTYVKAALMMGVVGKTGQDLGLEADGAGGEDPLLVRLSKDEATHRVLRLFKNRTVYANAINDGIVPLYTSALLYLDLEGHQEMEEVEGEDVLNGHVLQKAVSVLSPNFQLGAKDEKVMNDGGFRKTSMIEAATSVLIPPLPTSKYLIDPSSREEVVIHDKVYTMDDLPRDEEIERPEAGMFMSFDFMMKFKTLEEQIAKNWHDGLAWRKVLVKLKPDAHNNIIVRRRFANAYGWPVVDHLISEHFGDYGDDGDVGVEGEDDGVEDVDLGKDLKLSDYDWVLNENFKDGIFDIGPTGMISNINETLDNFKNWNLNKKEEERLVVNDEEIQNELEVNTRLSEGYIP